MRSLIVCESWFGNTMKLAEAIRDELANFGDAELVGVDHDIETLEGIDLLVVGAPTHVHGMSSSMSRKAAVEEAGGEETDTGPGVRDSLKDLPKVKGTPAAAFDTRIEKSALLVGSAAKGIAKRLRRHGFRLVVPAESFFVLDTDGPLKDGDLERAVEWARSLAAELGESVQQPEEVKAT